MRETVFDMSNVRGGDAIVFCAGYAGVMTMHILKTIYDVQTIYCFDNNADKQNKVFWKSLVCAKPRFIPGNLPVFVCVYNEESANKIAEQCMELGYTRVFKVAKADVVRATMTIPDGEFLKIHCYAALGIDLDIDNVHTYNEKLQWLKLFDHTETYRSLTDKIAAKQIVSDWIGGQYVLPTIGQWGSFDEVDFKNLPDSFVLKCNHDSGSATVVDNKSMVDMAKLKRKYDDAMSYDYYYAEREWNYRGIKRKIFAEPKLTNADGSEVKDYKVFTFEGIPKLVQVDYTRFSHHMRAMYSPSWDWLGFSTEYPLCREVEPRPKAMDELLRLSEVLSKGLKHVRVDWYVVDGEIFFGEMTFHHGGGTEKFSDEYWNFRMGDWLGVLG